MFLHFAGHSLGMLRGPSHGAEEIAVLDTMRNHHFDTMGSSRSYMDFFLGFGWDASINMFVQGVLLWLLATTAKTRPAEARPFIALFTIAWVASVFLYLKFFFVAPVVFAILMAIVLGSAWVACSKSIRRLPGD
jgi:hypothetical protein